MEDSEKIIVSKPDDNSKSGFQYSVSNSGQDPLQCDSDHASLHEHLQKSLTLNAERERDGEDEEKKVAVNISEEEERGDEVEEDAKSEESNGDIKATAYEEKAEYEWIGAEEPEKKAEYDWIGAAKHENQDQYDWTGADEPEKSVEYNWIGTYEHGNKGEYGWNGAGEQDNKGEYDWNGAGEHDNKGEYGWKGADEHDNKGEYGWKGADEHDNKGEYGWNGADEHENRDGRYDSGSYYGSSDNNYARKYLYPVRPEAEDCAYYMRTGTCKFGSNCKFNHPVIRKNQAIKEKVKGREDLPENPGQTECKYYLRTGGCKFGNACRFNHSTVKVPLVNQTEELNFLGLPIRPGEKECPYYMRNGSCKYGANCRFNHPDPTTAGGSDPASGYGNGRSATLQSTSQSGVASWPSPRTINETAPFVPVMFSPAPVVPPQSPEWNGFQAPLYPPERSIHPLPAYVMTNPATETNAYTHLQKPQMVVDQFPERPGQSECTYYMKTGDCKFKMNCRFHHPKSRISKSLPCALSDIGLPLRPDQNICSHYSRYGICKFGPACKFDHPIQQSSSTVSSLDQLHALNDSVTAGEDTMAGNGKGNANGTYLGVRQPV
ncbi:zinc finger CCCH domain-containing protein 43-like isoform X2 [Tripterygium wilfordii]|uniref:zinc finger CCCH domain-containing protein 43-like isoform X2 n=1 Tax=Tripterygium wilfordii TaxID=458696 RepID=UPI0018F81141|nr:zinc finger CCCH domain-containing protein 43-like isoform X2 [Tripterygium wilfordii]